MNLFSFQLYLYVFHNIFMQTHAYGTQENNNNQIPNTKVCLNTVTVLSLFFVSCFILYSSSTLSVSCVLLPVVQLLFSSCLSFLSWPVRQMSLLCICTLLFVSEACLCSSLVRDFVFPDHQLLLSLFLYPAPAVLCLSLPVSY